MDPRTEMSAGLTILLEAILAEADDLPYLKAIWGELTEDDRISQHHEWRNMMGLLEDLHRAHESGELSEAQEDLYAKMGAKLREGLPILEALDLETPVRPPLDGGPPPVR